MSPSLKTAYPLEFDVLIWLFTETVAEGYVLTDNVACSTDINIEVTARIEHALLPSEST